MSSSLPLPFDRIVTSRTYIKYADIGLAALIILTFAMGIDFFRYQHALGEADLYRVMVGILDGAETGAGVNSPLHYDRAFGFGYLAAIYAFANPATLHDPDALMSLINEIGFWSILSGLPCFWLASRLLYGPRVAIAALLVFAFSPMMMELATSGHQSMPMFALLNAAAICLFVPVTGWRAVALWILAAVLLLAGMLTRGEIFLAFPWLVLSRIDTRSVRRFFLSGALRALPPMAALVAFYGLQQTLMGTSMGTTVGHYFSTFYTWSAVVPGFVYMAVGCGLLTTTAGILATIWIGRKAISDRHYATSGGLAGYLGPLALIIVPLLFFVPNPMPTRHFMLTLAGFSLLIGAWLASLPRIRLVAVAALGIALVGGDQVLAEATRPLLLRENDAHSPYLPVLTPYRTTTHANIGWEWQRHAALNERRQDEAAFGDRLLTSCSSHTLLLSDERQVFFARLYAAGQPVHARPFDFGPYFGVIGSVNGKTFIVLDKSPGWPDDALAAILADPSFDEYTIVEAPYSMSKYDKTPLPANRAARFGCRP